MNTEAMQKVLGNDAFAVVNSTFRYMDIAEQEIAAATKRYPRIKSKIHNAFKLMCPTEFISGRSDDVYRHHVNELLQRVARNQDTRPATDAELLCALMNAGLRAPMNSAGGLLVEHLFAKVLPGSMSKIGANVFREQWTNQLLEALSDARRQLSYASRCP